MALWNLSYNYPQIAYSFAVYFIQTYNQNPLNLFQVMTNESMMSHNGTEILGGTEILNYLAMSNIKNIDIPENAIDIQPSVYGSILFNIYGSYTQQGILSTSEVKRNIILTLTIIPDAYDSYFLLNLIIKTKDAGQSFLSFKF